MMPVLSEGVLCKKKKTKRKLQFQFSLGSFIFKRFSELKGIIKKTQKVLTRTINQQICHFEYFSEKLQDEKTLNTQFLFFNEKLPKNMSCVWVCALNSVANKNLLL